MEQFLTGDIWKEINKLFGKNQNKIACIAYVTSIQLKLSKGDILICDASKFAIKFGETSAKVLSNYFSKGVKIYCHSQLHSKMLVTDKFLVIGSANLSKRSAEKLTESAVVTDSDILLSQAKAFCYKLTNKGGSTLLTRKDIDALLRVKVVRQPFNPTLKSKVRDIIFGDKYWFISASLLSERTYSKIKETVDKTTSSISKRENIEEKDIGLLRWNAKTEFGKLAKVGDQIVMKFNNNSKTRSWVYPPSTILERQVIDGFVNFYHDESNQKKRKGWREFRDFIRKIDLDKSITIRTKMISKADINKVKQIWS